MTHDGGYLEIDSSVDWQPVKLMQGWRDVLAPPYSGDKKGRSILN